MNQYIHRQVVTRDFNGLAPEFPINVLSDNLQNLIYLIQYETQAPLCLIASSVLSVMALSSQDLANISPKVSLIFPISINQFVLASSGERKSTADKLLMKPVRDLENKLETQYQEDKKCYEKDISIWKSRYKALKLSFERAVKDGDATDCWEQLLTECLAKKPEAPVRKRLLMSDATSAALKQKLGKGCPSMGLFSDEAGIILSGELLRNTSLINSIWTGQPIEVDRATGESFRIENVRLGCMFMVQPGLFDEYIKRHGKHARDSGFFARALISEPRSTIGSRFQGQEDQIASTESLEWFHSRVTECLNQSFKRQDENAERICLTLSPGASERWFNEYNRIEGMCGPSGALVEYRDYASKHLEHVARIAGVLEMFGTGDAIVSDHTMYAAIRIANYYLESFIQIMADNSLPEEVEDVLKLRAWLKNNHHRFDYSMMQKNYIRQNGPNSLRNKGRLDRALNNLERNGEISMRKISKTMFVTYRPYDPYR